MKLVLFDLDNTLLAGDSDFEWAQFLIEQRVLDREVYEARNVEFYEQYKAGTLDIRDLRSLVDCIRLVRRTAMQTAVRMITTGVMLALLAGIAIKLKIFGGSP